MHIIVKLAHNTSNPCLAKGFIFYVVDCMFVNFFLAFSCKPFKNAFCNIDKHS